MMRLSWTILSCFLLLAAGCAPARDNEESGQLHKIEKEFLVRNASLDAIINNYLGYTQVILRQMKEMDYFKIGEKISPAPDEKGLRDFLRQTAESAGLSLMNADIKIRDASGVETPDKITGEKGFHYEPRHLLGTLDFQAALKPADLALAEKWFRETREKPGRLLLIKKIEFKSAEIRVSGEAYYFLPRKVVIHELPLYRFEEEAGKFNINGMDCIFRLQMLVAETNHRIHPVNQSLKVLSEANYNDAVLSLFFDLMKKTGGTRFSDVL
ncbi:MAG: hypothetical protein FJ088_11515 [Deltaproteobacteria bacterium]|nr:hypothetical protein [Deltaproteobacteria bacterium]